MTIIKQITDEIESVDGVRLLDVDPGKDTNRTVVTFVGEPERVVEAAFLAIRKAQELIDMSKHKGEHPRMGATDVCPFVPISGVTVEETVQYSYQLAQRVGSELGIPVYCYEYSAKKPERKNLATIRAGEYEALPVKMQDPGFAPDFGPNSFNARSGATVIGARDFLIAYNFNLNTTSVRRANSIAFDVREAGRVKQENGKNVVDANGEPVRIPGTCPGTKAIGWYIDEYGIAQVSMNITNINQTPVHIAFDEVCKSATARGMRITGSELVGLVPLQVMLDAGRYFLKKQQRSAGVSEKELIKIAVKSLGLDDLRPFEADKKIIEYVLREKTDAPLTSMSLRDFADETASESPAPGGGSISAYLGTLGVALAGMVANLSSHKKGWDERWEEFSKWAEQAQQLKDELIRLVDEDTKAFNGIMDAFKMPKNDDVEKQVRSEAIQKATRYAIEVPFRVMKATLKTFDVIKAMTEIGNPNSVSDVGVGALCAYAAVRGAHLNVKINAASYKDKDFIADILRQAAEIEEKAKGFEKEVLEIAEKKIAE